MYSVSAKKASLPGADVLAGAGTSRRAGRSAEEEEVRWRFGGGLVFGGVVAVGEMVVEVVVAQGSFRGMLGPVLGVRVLGGALSSSLRSREVELANDRRGG